MWKVTRPRNIRKPGLSFRTFETSNWAWDPVAQAYYWHRFYSHQPDLNYDNPAMRAAVFEVVDFWLAMGVDGLRAGCRTPTSTSGTALTVKTLPETHEYLKSLRRYIDEHYPNRMLLAEANQWPEDAAAYYARGGTSAI